MTPRIPASSHAADPAGPASPNSADNVLVASRIAKSFGPTVALRDASLGLRRGEVHAILGENGSGKSTLVKILSGVHRPDGGRLQVIGAGTVPFSGPRAALAAGVATVFQEVLVVGAQSVVDNVWLGTDRLLRGGLDRTTRRRRAAELLGALLGGEIDLDAPVESLSLSDQQACCIARALVREPRVLLLDEATSALDLATRDRMFDLVRQRTRSGCATVFISHRMDEIERFSDRVTVMRTGCTVGTFARGETTARELVRLMTGVDHLGAAPSATPACEAGDVVLRARGLRLTPTAAPIDLAVRAGEVVGVAGLEGHGQTAFLHALWGDGRYEGDVLRVRAGQETPLRSTRSAAACGVAYVPRDRRADSIFAQLSVRENFGLATLPRDRRAGLISHRRTGRRLAAYVDRLAVRTGAISNPISTLSGGNQQKVVVARWLACDPQVLLLDDPTRGIDLGAKRDLHRELRRLTEEGVAVVMLSSELEEHLDLMDRALVFREHTVFAQLTREQLNREALVAAFFGHQETP
jgi:ABC-type sugar transport system ATPase subunit